MHLSKAMRTNGRPAKSVLPNPNAVKAYIRDVGKIRTRLLDKAYPLKTSEPLEKPVQL